MLSKVFEWSRIVHPTPDDDFVAKRTLVVTALVNAFSSNVDRLIDCACVAAIGVTPRFSQDSALISEVIDAIKKEQPATPEALSENKENVRSCCALVVGEIAAREAKKKERVSPQGQVMLAVLSAALANRPPPIQKHIREMVSELALACEGASKHAAEHRHERYSLSRYINKIQEAPDVPAFWKAAQPHLVGLVDAIEQNESVTREELDTMWWAFNGASLVTGNTFAETSSGLAALASAADLSDLVVLPPLPNTRLLLRRVLRAGRSAQELKGRTLREQIAEWDKSTAEQFLPSVAKVTELVRSNPAVFPVSWACGRVADGQANLADMKKLTLWDPAASVLPETIAFQAFEEKVAQRLYENLVE